MAEALKTFREGEDILASETNENNQFLLSKLSDNAAQVQSYVEGEVATIKSNVASVQATLQNNIDELDAKKPIYVTEFTQDGSNICRVWSNGLMELWGTVEANKPVTFAKAFANTNYNLQVRLNSNHDNWIQATYWHVTKTTTGFSSLRQSFVRDWYAVGKKA